MPLPASQPRTLAHTRQVSYQGFRRDDGLWDIEGHLCDTKPQAFHIQGEGTWQADEPIHDMRIRVTVNAQLVIQEIAVAMDSVPHGECPPAQEPMQQMVGCTMGAGWRRAIDERLGNAKGCTHLRELLFNMATAAFQTITSNFGQTQPDVPPPHLGRCLSWGFESPLVARQYPMFFKWQPKKPPTSTAP
ncbi:DUF2889 domain-containing protein [Limnohabitans sp. JirII-31]|uniref:DUF2889 domain-containing protein n=1 Tax=Limnohabitans sp. JirII-31 TaxID=1977908 RepID=UPI000C1ED301|nr:DUF2889 domain-containing protein [Limnohabitans sp. JirII-31]PIT79696.1 hypothetical protein B9Z41_03665 [Limnohabitans sp. JirII-31]